MKIVIAAIALTLFCSKAFCQDTNAEVANIKAYVCNVDTNRKLYLQGVPRTNHDDEYSIHNTIDYMARDKPYASRKVKTIKTDRTISSFYFKDDRLVYLKEIIPMHDNYAEIKETYYKDGSIIFSKASFCVERILQIEYWCSGNMRTSPYSLKITQDSINYSTGGKKLQSRSSKDDWNNLKGALNLTAFDNIKSGNLEAYIDGTDMGYTIITDIRTHSFANSYPAYDKALTKLTPFINQIQKLVQSFQK